LEEKWYIVNDIETWHEINRPQIHGYDFNTLTCLNYENDKTSLNKLVTGADEKIIRIFQPCFNIVKYLQSLSGVTINYSKEHDNNYYDKRK
jgi:elongator complex protein 2